MLDLLNRLVELGVAGFRVDAAKHIWPADLKYIYNNTKDLNPKFGFKRGARPFIYQEVSYFGELGTPTLLLSQRRELLFLQRW